MLGFTLLAWPDGVPAPPGAVEPVEITAEPDIELDVGDGALLTES